MILTHCGRGVLFKDWVLGRFTRFYDPDFDIIKATPSLIQEHFKGEFKEYFKDTYLNSTRTILKDNFETNSPDYFRTTL